ncbi:putative GTPase [Agromyces terreus]|uniref:GTPase n=1 Tax=Agromyces terreus TaxID=424795 RepID=A0A9X2H1J7_9MICO|nr:GTPase [Agromyces terreus]MCP2370893.1 putative GTPase [Agromyces terreus]
MSANAEEESPDLSEAIAHAIQSGSDELARLEGIVDEASSRLLGAWNALSFSTPSATKTGDGFFTLLDGVVGDLKDRLAERRGAGSTFNLVFFGRTGAGKSTLLSALGGLDGELVSDGRSDFTTDVRSLDWNGCRLYDTPGINGWGRTQSRTSLENTAREAVQVADIVLLCFDSQGPQASEFAKVADWVRAYGKPAIAVLNMRNTLWRHPARTPKIGHRTQLSATARQHTDTITSELEAIGLPGVPVVALNSSRALMARAKLPFLGTGATELTLNRSAYGIDHLEQWSNLPALEELISACILEGAGDLRLVALREGFRARLLELADEVDRISAHELQRAEVFEATISAWLSNLGYPEPPTSGTDPLRQLEAARGEPFTAPVLGQLEGHVRQLLKSHLYRLRKQSLREAATLILDAFGDNRTVKDNEFESAVLDDRALTSVLNDVASRANEFLSTNLGIAARDAQINIDLIERTTVAVRGSAGRGHRFGANILRGLGLLSGAASAALGILAVTNFWNPAGWVAGLIVVGTGVLSAVTGFFGRKARKAAESRRVTARASAIAAARGVVNSYYDSCESEQLARLLSACRESAAAELDALIRDAHHRRVGCATLRAEAEWLRYQATEQPVANSAADIIRRATDRMITRHRGWDPPSLDALLLGEDWLLPEDGDSTPDQYSDQDRDRYQLVAARDRSQFVSFLRDASLLSQAEEVEAWFDRALSAGALDESERAELVTARTLLREAPHVVALGDYSSGKSSLIKRLLAEAGVTTPSGLHVAGGAATDAASSYPVGSLILVDVPGLQSGRLGHDDAAVEASRNAALLIVVLHVNLLIGDSTPLERMLLGDEWRIGKAARTVYVIGRSDEVGSDPQHASREFLGRTRRKVEELRSILRSKGISAEQAIVLPLSADPYGLVGDRNPVTATDYPSEARLWDGVAALAGPLLTIEAETRAGLSAAAALDRGRSSVMSIVHRLRAQVAETEQAVAIAMRLGQLAETSLAELRLLTRSTERRIRSAVEEHAREMVEEAVGAAPSEVTSVTKRLQTWWDDPRLESALHSQQSIIERDLDDWWRRHSSELDRELRRIDFTIDPSGLPVADDGRGAAFGEGIGAAARVVHGAHQVGRALGNRDAVYAIGKAMQFKFKPWGAVKLGAKVGKAAAILGVVAVAFDIVEFVNDQVQQERRERARTTAAEHVRSTAEVVIDDLLADPDGPINYLRQCDAQFMDELARLRSETALQREHAHALAQSINQLDLLQAAGAELAVGKKERTVA